MAPAYLILSLVKFLALGKIIKESCEEELVKQNGVMFSFS